MTALTEAEYAAALDDLAEYERRIAESDQLSQRDSLKVAETLDRLYHDERWVEERNAQRAATAKTAKGGRPVDPTSRSQFSTWVRERYNRFAPQVTYRLLDAHMIRSSFLTGGEVTPTAEWQVRPLKSLLSVANGQGARIPDVWDLACKLAADAGRNQPTSEDVKHAKDEWRRINLPPAQARKERAEDSAWVKERHAEAAWKELLRVGGSDQINAFLAVVNQDVEQLHATLGQR
jgi:hypothetical protein